MILTLTRKPTTPEYTEGAIVIDGKHFCDTIEDTVRQDPDPSTSQNEAKVYGKTAIPAGSYEVVLSPSPRFKRVLPELMNVPGYTGVRIHPMNTAADSEGCIGVGLSDAPGHITKSRYTMARLMAVLQQTWDKKEPIYINII